MGVQIASSAISGGGLIALASGAPPGGWLAWGIGLLIPLGGVVVALVAYRTGRSDRHQDRAIEAVSDFQKLVDEIELEQSLLIRGDVVSAEDLKPLRDLQLKAELAPDRLPQPLKLCARELESRTCQVPRGGRTGARRVLGRATRGPGEHRMYTGQDLKRAIEAANNALAAHKARRKG